MFSSIENCKSVDEISRVMRSSIPLPLADCLLEELVTDARDFALLHGEYLDDLQMFDLYVCFILQQFTVNLSILLIAGLTI